MSNSENSDKELWAYLRVSSKKQADKNLSIPVQKESVIAWARAQGRTITRFYVDKGYSAFREDVDRPAFNELLYEAKGPASADVIVLRYNRFSRDRLAGAAAQYELKRNGCNLLSVEESLDSAKNPMAGINSAVIEAMAEIQSAQISAGVRSSKNLQARKGSYPGSQPPYGYDRIRTKDTVTCPVRPDTAKVVRRIFNLCIQGKGATEIAAELNGKGIPSPGGKEWYIATIHRLLHNPAYKGDLLWSGKIYPDFFKPLVSREDWDRAQEGLTERYRDKTGRPKTKTSGFVLTGLIYGVCGHRYYGQVKPGGAPGSYLCNRKKMRGASACDNPNVPAPTSDAIVMQAILNVALNPETMERLRLKTLKADKDRKPEKELAAAYKRIEAAEAKRERLLDAVENGMDPARAGARDKKLAAEIGTLRDKIRQINSDETKGPGLKASWESTEAFAELLREHWLDMPAELARETVNAFVRKVVVLKSGKLKIFFGYPSGGSLPPVTRKPKGRKRTKKTGTKDTPESWWPSHFGTKEKPINPSLDLACFAHTTANVRSGIRKPRNR